MKHGLAKTFDFGIDNLQEKERGNNRKERHET